jgi:hypothetical protein
MECRAGRGLFAVAAATLRRSVDGAAHHSSGGAVACSVPGWYHTDRRPVLGTVGVLVCVSVITGRYRQAASARA